MTHSATVRAVLDLGLVLGHLDPHRGQIEHLAFLHGFCIDILQGSLTVPTAFHTIYLHPVRMAHRPQCGSRVPGLSTTFLAVPFTQTLRLRFT